MIPREIVLGQTKESRKYAIQRNLGLQVILNDSHEGWCHGVLLKEKSDNEVYQMEIFDVRGQRQLTYQNLNQLLIMLSSSD